MIYGCGLLIVDRLLRRKRHKLNKRQLEPRAVSGKTFRRF